MSAGLAFRAASRETTPTVPSPMAGYSSAGDGNTEVTRAGITFQRASGSAGATNTSGAWSSGDATEFDGNYGGLNGTDAARFRLVLPGGSGSYALRVAHTLRFYLRSRVRIYDTDGTATLGSGTLLATSDASTATIDGDEPSDQGRYIDAAGTLRDFTVPLASSTATSAFSVSGGHVWVELSTIGGSFNCQVAALSLTPAGAVSVDAPETNTITQGTTLNVPVTITRTAPFAGDVPITATGLTSGVTAAPLTIAAGNTTGTLVLTATTGATPVTNDAWQVVASGAGVADATDSVTLTVLEATATTPAPQSWAAAITQRFAGATERVPLPLLVNVSTGQLLTSATGITIDFRSVADRAAGNAYTLAPSGISLIYAGKPGSFDLALRDTDDASLGVVSAYLSGACAPVEVHVQVLSPDARTVPTPSQNADGYLARAVQGGADGGRTVSMSLQSTGINRIGITGTGSNRVLTQFGVDDTTPLYTQTLSGVTTLAFTESDPT